MPWQIKSTLIIIFFLLKCLVLPYFTHFFGFLQDLQFFGNCSKSGKIRQFGTKCSSLQQSIGNQFRGCRLPRFLNRLTIEKRRGVHSHTPFRLFLGKSSIQYSFQRFIFFYSHGQINPCIYHMCKTFSGIIFFHIVYKQPYTIH